MPELPEVERVRRDLEPVLVGVRVTRVVLKRSNLRRPFPAGFVGRLEGTTVRALTRRGKYLLADLSSGETLLVHLGMSGSFRVAPTSAGGATGSEPLGPHDHVVFELASGVLILFNDPRRFGVMDLMRTNAVADRLPLGPEPLDPVFDAAVLARACARKRTTVKAVLLDQRVVAGLGNIYASEALHRARLSPRRRASTLATRSSQPLASTRRLAVAIKDVLTAAIARVPEGSYRGRRFRVYDREGEPCPRRGCGGVIRRIVQAGRSTFYCPGCQR